MLIKHHKSNGWRCIRSSAYKCKKIWEMEMVIKGLMKITALLFAGLMSVSANATTTGLDFAGGCPEGSISTLCDQGSNADEYNVAAILGVDVSLVSQLSSGFDVTGIGSKFGDWSVSDTSITHIAFKSSGYFILGEVNASAGTWDNTDWDLTLAICPDTICAVEREYNWDDFKNNGGQIAELSNARAFSVVPVPAAVWLFASGLLGLIGIARKRA
jgi:hypothetical protein